MYVTWSMRLIASAANAESGFDAYRLPPVHKVDRWITAELLDLYLQFWCGLRPQRMLRLTKTNRGHSVGNRTHDATRIDLDHTGRVDQVFDVAAHVVPAAARKLPGDDQLASSSRTDQAQLLRIAFAKLNAECDQWNRFWGSCSERLLRYDQSAEN